MITLKSINEVKYNEFDEIWLIVRSAGKSQSMLKQPNVKHVPALSPSKNLFFRYLQWQKDKFWGKQCFETKYAPQFIAEAKQSPDFVSAMTTLKNLDSMGKSIALVCFCKDETLCHRSIVGALCAINDMTMADPIKANEYVQKYFPKH